MPKKNKKINEYNDLEEYLRANATNKWKDSHSSRTLFQAYEQLKINLKELQDNIIAGAMADEIRRSISNLNDELKKKEEKGEHGEMGRWDTGTLGRDGMGWRERAVAGFSRLGRFGACNGGREGVKCRPVSRKRMNEEG